MKQKQKRQYRWKANTVSNSYNDWGVGTFFDTCLILGRLLQYKIQHLYSHFPEVWILKSVQFFVLVGCLEHENKEFWLKFLSSY